MIGIFLTALPFALASGCYAELFEGFTRSVESSQNRQAVTLLIQERDALEELWSEFQKASQLGKLAEQEKILDSILKLKSDSSAAYYYRGRTRFQAGSIKESIQDFDRHVELSPKLKSRQWERGIALYYGKQFKRGADQFELYQTYHDNDVENSAWRFLCVAKASSIEAARKNLLPIRNDRRLPMMSIYKLYQGNLTPQDVLAEVEAAEVSDTERKSGLFYAHLYIGLLYEVQGQAEKSLKHIKLAKENRISHYMWNVADVHHKLRSEEGRK